MKMNIFIEQQSNTIPLSLAWTEKAAARSSGRVCTARTELEHPEKPSQGIEK